MTNSKKKTFEQNMCFIGFFCNFGAVAVYLFYSFIFSQITFFELAQIVALGSILLVVMQYIVGPLFSNKVYTHKISKVIEEWEKTGLDTEGRTKLLSDLMKRPFYKGVEIFFVYFTSGIIFCSFFWFKIKVTLPIEIGIIVAMLFAAFVDGILAMHVTEKYCSSIAKKIISQGINNDYVMQYKFFGMSLTRLYSLFIFIPIISTNILTGIYIFNIFLTGGKINSFIDLFSIIAVPVFNALITIILAIFIGKRLLSYLNNMQSAIIAMDQTNITNSEAIPTDLSNEISFNMFLINKAIGLFKLMFEKTSDVAYHITESTHTLESLSAETASTALEQSTGVKEIVSTMEDADHLFKNIESKVGDVTLVANKTSDEVQTGINSLTENMTKMQQITEANIETISGIKTLSEKIDSIWEIVTMINSIADQTKIIAFNAELEASSAGEAGKNFHIVANEIRRLADSTMEFTHEIKERITEIQHSSDNLIITSEGGTEKIHEGTLITEKVSQNFNSIKEAAEITAESAQDIQIIVAQQTAAFEQIVITLKQISAGSDNFSASTQTIKNAVEKLQTLSDSMKKLIVN